MSEQKEVSILQQLKKQHAQFCAQRDQVQNNFQQLVGAIYACEVMIKQHEENLKKAAEKLAQEVAKSGENQGEGDVQANSETTEQAA